jgi:hypothetical protein
MSNELKELQHRLWLERDINRELENKVRLTILQAQAEMLVIEALRMRRDVEQQLKFGTLLPRYFVQPVSIGND